MVGHSFFKGDERIDSHVGVGFVRHAEQKVRGITKPHLAFAGAMAVKLLTTLVSKSLMQVALLGLVPLHPAPNPVHTPAGPFLPTRGVARVLGAGPWFWPTLLNRSANCSGEMLVYEALGPVGEVSAGGLSVVIAMRDGLERARDNLRTRAGDWKRSRGDVLAVRGGVEGESPIVMKINDEGDGLDITEGTG